MSYSVALGSNAISYEVLHSTIDKAFAAWRETPCDESGATANILPADVYGAVKCQEHEYNPSQPNSNTIVYLEGPWPYPESNESALALTSVTYDKATGRILDADMEINGSGSFAISANDVPSDTQYDLQSILTHEVGHFLGLAHAINGAATMGKYYPTNNVEYRSLKPDDVAGICTVYPPGRSTALCDYQPHLGFSPECRMDVVVGGCNMATRTNGRPMTVPVAVGLLVGFLVSAGCWRSARAGRDRSRWR